MKTVIHGRMVNGGHEEFSAPVFFGIALVIAAVVAGILFAAGLLLGLDSFLVHHRGAFFLLCLLTGLVSSSCITDRRENRD